MKKLLSTISLVLAMVFPSLAGQYHGNIDGMAGGATNAPDGTPLVSQGNWSTFALFGVVSGSPSIPHTGGSPYYVYSSDGYSWKGMNGISQTGYGVNDNEFSMFQFGSMNYLLCDTNNSNTYTVTRIRTSAITNGFTSWAVAADINWKTFIGPATWSRAPFMTSIGGTNYLIASISTNGGTMFQPAVLVASDATLTNYTFLGLISRTSVNADFTDTRIYYVSNLWYMVWKDDSAKTIGVSTNSTGILGAYSNVVTGIGYSGASQMPFLEPLPNGKWRLYFNNFGYPLGEYFVDANNPIAGNGFGSSAGVVSVQDMGGFVPLVCHDLVTRLTAADAAAQSDVGNMGNLLSTNVSTANWSVNTWGIGGSYNHSGAQWFQQINGMEVGLMQYDPGTITFPNDPAGLSYIGWFYWWCPAGSKTTIVNNILDVTNTATGTWGTINAGQVNSTNLLNLGVVGLTTNITATQLGVKSFYFTNGILIKIQ
jgi:hypothetical protein